MKHHALSLFCSRSRVLRSLAVTRVASTFFAATLLFSVGSAQDSRIVSDVDRRAGPRNTFQKPIAWDVRDHTVLFEGIVFGGGTYLFEDVNTQGLVPPGADALQSLYGGVFDLRVMRKLPNTFAYGVDGRLIVDGQDGGQATDGRFDVFVRNFWGQFSYGNFADRDEILIAPRAGLSGEANLFYDGFFNPSDARAFRYRGRFSSFLVDTAVDEDADNYNIGILYRSPTTYRKDAWSFDYHGGDFLGRYDRDGVTLGYQISYGSLDVKIAGAWDWFDPVGPFADFERVSGSLATSYKVRALTLSAGVMLSETNGGDLETAYTTGLRYDLARGLSWNAGWFYLDSPSFGSDGLPVTAGEFSGVRTSISYRF